VLLGQRVVVRSRTGDLGPSGGPELTDVIGHVRALTDDLITVERRDGALVDIRRSDVVTWKEVPERER
jgi:hypothetical protein